MDDEEKKVKSNIKMCASDRLLQIITTIILVVLLVSVAYPLIFILSSSFSSSPAIKAGRIWLYPMVTDAVTNKSVFGISLDGYKFVFHYKDVWIGYRNTLFYTVVGTVINLFMTVICAYPLSKSDFQGRGKYMGLFFFTMLFGAGLIPHYIVISKLGLINSVWVMMIPGAMSVYDMIIVRTAFKNSIPNELFEAAKMDGASDFACLWKIAIPLAKSTLSVITLYYAIGHWNAYFNALIYLRDKEKFPLQLFLRNILTASESIDMSEVSSTMEELMGQGTEGIKYALIVVSTVPLLVLYMVTQKYFKKGVMVGSVKG